MHVSLFAQGARVRAFYRAGARPRASPGAGFFRWAAPGTPMMDKRINPAAKSERPAGAPQSGA